MTGNHVMSSAVKPHSAPLRRWWPLIPGLMVAAFAAHSWWHLKSSATAEADVWSLFRPERRTLTSTVVATGAVRLRIGAQVRVGAQLSGVVRKLRVSVGSHVSKDELIAQIDTRAVEARLAQARAQVALERAALGKVRSDLRRSEALLAETLVPLQQTQDLRWELERAEASLAKAEADLEGARVDLAHAEVRAPIAGTIASVSTQEGETIATSFATPTFVTIIDDSALELVAMVDETDIGGVRGGQRVTFTTEAFPAREVAGTVERVNPTATILSGVVNYEVVVRIETGLDLLRPDMTANVVIEIDRREAIVVPDAALHRSGDGSIVYVKEAGGFRQRVVSVGTRETGFTEIKRGLGTDDQVLLGVPPPATQGGSVR